MDTLGPTNIVLCPDFPGQLKHRYTKLYNRIGNGSNSRDVSVQIPNVT